MFDTIGTLVGVSTKAGMIDEKGRVKNIKQAFMADAIATTAGACLGTSTTTTYVESASGVAVGGRSGLTAFTVGVCFAIAMFFSPLFLSIPAAATAPVLILVGLMMLENITKVEFHDFSEAIPAFVCMIAMPMTYSISNGILLGIIAYAVINLLCGKFKKLTPTICILAVLFILKFMFMKPGEKDNDSDAAAATTELAEGGIDGSCAMPCEAQGEMFEDTAPTDSLGNW
jgi:AGZA family xanthine/uracil permease-like MFS transporter